LSARIAQRAWSLMHGKNVLAANYGGNGEKSSGSGIWQKGLKKVSFYNPKKEPQSQLLVADVKTVGQQAQVVV